MINSELTEKRRPGLIKLAQPPNFLNVPDVFSQKDGGSGSLSGEATSANSGVVLRQGIASVLRDYYFRDFGPGQIFTHYLKLISPTRISP